MGDLARPGVSLEKHAAYTKVSTHVYFPVLTVWNWLACVTATGNSVAFAVHVLCITDWLMSASLWPRVGSRSC